MRWDTVIEGGGPTRGSKKAYGLILCRPPDEACPSYRAILVRGRCTYAFAEFVHGYYSRTDNLVAKDLIRNMTMDERLTINTLRFQKIWEKFWMTTEVDAQYAAKCRKFHETWLQADGGEALKRIIHQTKGVGEVHWDFPKGRPFGVHENPLRCALREFKEETCIPSDSFQVVPGFRREDIYTHMGVQYHTCYFLAVQTGRLVDPQRCLSARNHDQITEIADIRWMTASEMDHVKGPAGRGLRSLALPAFNKLRNIRRGISPLVMHLRIDPPANPIQIAIDRGAIQVGNTNEWVRVRHKNSDSEPPRWAAAVAAQ